MIKIFSEIEKNEYELAGGKGQSLARMIKAGFNIPNGFVVGANIFSELIESEKLNKKINKILSNCNIENAKSLEKSSKKIQKLILQLNLPETIQIEILNAFNNLNCKYIAVRSSATVEDGKTNAWAGQLETYLFVDKNSLIEYIKKCWASLFGTRAIYYRIKNNFTQNISVAVVVQEMVDSEVSGVAFSSDPNCNEQIVIECVEGLGEAIVSGAVTPDKYSILGNNIKIQVANQTKKLCFKNGEIKYCPITNNNQKLENANILKLKETVIKIKEFYGFEVDVEWCFKENKLYILQCRPITTKSNNMQKIAKDILYSDSWQFYVKRPFHWMLESTQILAGSESEQNKYLGFNIALQNYLILNGDEYFSLNEDDKNKAILKDLLNKNPNFFDDYAETLFKIVDENLEYVDEIKNTRIELLNNDELLKEYKKFKNNYLKSVVPTFGRPDFFLESEFYNILKEDYNYSEDVCKDIFAKVATCSNEFGPLFYSEEPLDLLKISQAKIQGENIENLIISHHEKYSWLKAPVIEETTMFSKDDYFNRINNLIAQGSVLEKIENILKAREENDIMFEETIRKYNLGGRALKMAQTLRTFIFLRTYMTEHTDHLFFNGRVTILKEICIRFKIEECDLVMLSLDEVEKVISGVTSLTGLYPLIKARRIGYAMVWINKVCKVYFGEDALELQNIIANELLSVKDEANNSTIITGEIANKGKVKGMAKILLSYEDIKKVNNGDIIVASMTTPDYISAMEKAVGFVTDEGGITCHAAIISREFAIPCIVGTLNATKIIKDGDLIELDAYNGIVKILSEDD